MTSVRLMQALLPAPETHFPAVVAVATCTWGIISLWAATSQRPWILRAMVLCLLLSFLVAILAYGPILYFLLQSAVVVLGVAIWSAKRVRSGSTARYERSSTLHLRFSLRELLFITVFLAIILSILARMDWHPPMVWASLFATGLTSGIVTLLAAWVSLPRPTWSKRLRDVVLAMLLTTISAVPTVATDRLLLSFPDWGRAPRAAYDPAWIILLLGILFGIYTWLMLYSMASRDAGQTGYRWLSRVALLGWSIVLVAPCIDLYLALPARSAPPEPMLVEDNGFEEINEAALKLYVPHAAIDDPAQATSGQLRLGLKQNAETLATIRRGLSKTCVRELTYDKDVTWGSIGAPAQRIERSLDRLLMAEGELAEREGRIDDAIASYVDLVRLSRATKNGGLALDALVARKIESMAIGGIAGLRDRLSSLQRGYLTAVLVDLDRQREDHQTVLERDIAWGQAVYGWRALLSDVLEQIEAKWNADEKSFQRTEAGTRLLIVEFAIEDYKQEQGRLPRGLGDLKLDTDLLRDPFSPHGALLKYRLDHNDFLVYSVGADGDEDGGRPPEDGWIGDGDYQLDAIYPSEAE